MAYFRALTDFDIVNPLRRKVHIRAGQLIDIANRHVANELLRAGRIGPRDESWQARLLMPHKPAPLGAKTLRVAICLRTSAHYSGGRLFMFQYASTLAASGAEVFLVTDRDPKWVRDYPKQDRLYVLVNKTPPPDCDLIVTDNKAAFGLKADLLRQRMPGARFVAFNFESPNWVRAFIPKYAAALEAQGGQALYRQADLIVSISEEGARHMAEWVGAGCPEQAVLYPCVNTPALKAATAPPAELAGRRYMAWCARAATYKNAGLAYEAVCACPGQMDLAVVGNIRIDKPRPDQGGPHRLHRFAAIPDTVKYGLFRGAHAVLAPSEFEGFGLVPGEAMSMGTPCVVYDLPVLREVYGDRLVYVPHGDRAAYVKAVRGVAAAAKRPADAAWVRQTYGLDGMADRIERLPYHTVRRKRITAMMICYNTASAVEAVESVYPFVDEVLIAYGRIPLYPAAREGDVLARLRDMPDPGQKVRIEARGQWEDKLQMRRWCLDRARGNCLLVLDADEIWDGMEAWVRCEHKAVLWGGPRWCHLWHDGAHWIADDTRNAGQRWGRRVKPFGSVATHYRFSWWRPSFRFTSHCRAATYSGASIASIEANQAAYEACPETVIYHLGHCLPSPLMKAKHAFYLKRDGTDASRVRRRDVWNNWRGQTGDVGDGVVEAVTWPLPELVRLGLQRIQNTGGTEKPSGT